MTKAQFEKVLKTKLDEKSRQDILTKIRNYKKIDYFAVKEEKFEVKPYFKTMTLQESRMLFSIRTNTTKTVKTCFMSDKKYANQLWKCQNCEKIDSISHIKNCQFYEHLRENVDFSKETDLVNYFIEIIKLRNSEQ